MQQYLCVSSLKCCCINLNLNKMSAIPSQSGAEQILQTVKEGFVTLVHHVFSNRSSASFLKNCDIYHVKENVA